MRDARRRDSSAPAPGRRDAPALSNQLQASSSAFITGSAMVINGGIFRCSELNSSPSPSRRLPLASDERVSREETDGMAGWPWPLAPPPPGFDRKRCPFRLALSGEAYARRILAVQAAGGRPRAKRGSAAQPRCWQRRGLRASMSRSAASAVVPVDRSAACPARCPAVRQEASRLTSPFRRRRSRRCRADAG
jgi:hypothetical protein